MLRLFRERDTVEVVDDQKGCPTFAADLAEALLDLAAVREASGIFHIVNRGATTWYGFAREIAARSGASTRIVPVTTDRVPRRARRPANSVLADRRRAIAGLPALPAWEDGVARCLARAGSPLAG